MKDPTISREELDAELGELRALATSIRDAGTLRRTVMYPMIVRLFDAGAHYKELADACGYTSHQSIYQILQKYGRHPDGAPAPIDLGGSDE